MPTPYLSISGLRVFGIGQGKQLAAVKYFSVSRSEDRKEALISWDKVPDAQGYNVLWGIARDKLYSSWILYDKNQLDLRSFSTDQEYYFTIEAFNENGVSKRSVPVKFK